MWSRREVKGTKCIVAKNLIPIYAGEIYAGEKAVRCGQDSIC